MTAAHDHEHKSLKDEINDILVLRKSSEFAGYSPIKQFGLTMTEVLEAGCELAHTIKDQDMLIKTLEEVFEEQIVPIDLPLNDALEFTLEMAGRQLIRPVVTAVYQRLNK